MSFHNTLKRENLRTKIPIARALILPSYYLKKKRTHQTKDLKTINLLKFSFILIFSIYSSLIKFFFRLLIAMLIFLRQIQSTDGPTCPLRCTPQSWLYISGAPLLSPVGSWADNLLDDSSRQTARKRTCSLREASKLPANGGPGNCPYCRPDPCCASIENC